MAERYMRSMILEKPHKSLILSERPIPLPGNGQVLIKVNSCGVCRTDLHIMDGDLPHPHLPLIMGHQIVGIVETVGGEVTSFSEGDRIGVPWLAESCGECDYCLSERENLCDQAVYTGYQADGGFSEYCIANADYCFHMPDKYSDVELAPLLCGGLIGFRAYRMTGTAKKIGFFGFGSSTL